MRCVVRKVGERWPPWKAGLYDSEVVSLWGHYFWTGGLAYDSFQIIHNYLFKVYVLSIRCNYTVQHYSF